MGLVGWLTFANRLILFFYNSIKLLTEQLFFVIWTILSRPLLLYKWNKIK